MELTVHSEWGENSAGNDEITIAGYVGETWFEESDAYTGYAWDLRHTDGPHRTLRVSEGQARDALEARDCVEAAIRQAHRINGG